MQHAPYATDVACTPGFLLHSFFLLAFFSDCVKNDIIRSMTQ